jgi:flagellar biosynthesis/type III secretory pathway chaperone
MIQEIVSKIEEMIDVHQTLNQLATEKTDAVVNGDIKSLDRIVNREEVETLRLTQLEDERVKLVQVYTKEHGGETTFTALIENAPEEERERLTELQSKLAENVFMLKHQNDLNQDLIKQSLDWIQVNQKLLDPRKMPANYNNPRTGQKQEKPSISQFDSRA